MYKNERGITKYKLYKDDEGNRGSNIFYMQILCFNIIKLIF